MKMIVVDEPTQKKLQTILGRYGTYEAFSRCREDASAFVDILNVRICPYCNIMYVCVVYHQKRRREIASLLGFGSGDLLRVLLTDEDCEINKTSLGKMKRDIIREYR